MSPRLTRFALLAPLALFAAFLLVVTSGHPGPHAPVPGPLVGHRVPAFDLPGYDATHPGLAAADLAHGTPTVVNFFASWCLPCRVEAPRLAALAAKGIPVHGIALHDTPAGLATFFRTYGNPYRRIGMDAGGKVHAELGTSGIPETFVIDGEGIVRAEHAGGIHADDLPVLEAEVARAKGETGNR